MSSKVATRIALFCYIIDSVPIPLGTTKTLQCDPVACCFSVLHVYKRACMGPSTAVKNTVSGMVGAARGVLLVMLNESTEIGTGKRTTLQHLFSMSG